ncbi:MAG: stage 0 sporulation protein, partial [Bacteroidetes bacterium]
VNTPRGEGKVVRVNALSQKISVYLGEDGIQDFDPDEVERINR